MRRGRGTSLGDREAAVYRVLEGTPDAVVAHELGVTVLSVRSWIDHWQRRVGPWNGRPLEQAAIDRGFVPGDRDPGDREADMFSSRRQVHRLEGLRLTDSERALDELLTILNRIPIESRTALEQAYQRLDDSARALVGPAYDLYLQAADMMDGVRRTQRAAAELAAREVAESKTSPIARAA